MKAAVYYENGSPEVFRYEHVADPTPRPTEVLIAVEAVSIEGGDTLSRLGGALRTSPHIVGYQAAGTVIGHGEQVGSFGIGDRVVTIAMDGSHAEQRTADQSACWKIPEGLDTVDASVVPVGYGTAHDCLFEFGRLQAGETVLVHAGAGGVGVAAIQFAHRAGARVMATASSDDRLERLRDLGLDEGINYVSDDFVAAARSLTDGRGVDVIVDSVGGDTLRGSLAALAYRGRCVSVGDAGRGAPEPLDVSGMRGNNQTLVGYFLGAELFAGDRAYKMISAILDDMAAGSVHAVIDRVFPLEEAGAAHAYIESRQAFGRVLLTTA